MKRKCVFLSVLLLVLCVLAVPAAAEGEPALVDSGEFGNGFAWALYDDGTLYINGSGEMGYLGYESAPWYNSRAQITSAVLADGITSIGGSAFSGCTGLTSLTIPNSVTTIGNSAFSGCTGLTTLTIPDSVTTIGGSAFSRCTGLTTLTIPDSVMTIGESTFFYCTGLKSITLPAGLMSVEGAMFLGCNVLTALTIPDSVTTIGNNVFYGCTSLKKITLPAGLTTIGNYAFYDCTGLTSLTIPDSVTTIGDSAFQNCTGLTSVEFLGDAPVTVGTNIFSNGGAGSFVIYYHPEANGWTSPTWNGYPCACLGEVGSVDALDGDNRNAQGLLFTLNDAAKTATVGDNTTASNNAGYYGNGDGRVTIPGAVTKDGVSYKVIGIGQYAFSNNRFLRQLELGPNITSVDPTAFTGCPSFTAFTVGEGSTSFKAVDGVLYDTVGYYLYVYPCGKTDTEVTVPATVKTIGKSAFLGCTALREVTVPQTVTAIGSGAFYGCTGLERLTLPFLGGSASDSYGLDYVYRPNYVYGEEATGLKEVTITGEGLKGSDFMGASYLERITLPTCGDTIPYSSFSGCTNLVSLRFVDQDLDYEDGVICIPDCVTSIELDAFSRCTSIRAFSVSSSNTGYCTDKWGVLYTKDKSVLLYYPAARIWPYYNVADETRTLSNYTFYGCGNLVNLYIPGTVEQFSYGAVSNCPGLTVCVYMNTPAADYASSANLTAWYMDNYTLQGIEIYSLPEETALAIGQEDLTGLYMVANYGGRQLQLDEYTVSYSAAGSGAQTATVTGEGMSTSFEVVRYNAAAETVLDFGNVSAADGALLLCATYDGDGRMTSVQQVTPVNGEALVVLSKQTPADRAALFRLDAGSLAPLAAPLTP